MIKETKNEQFGEKGKILTSANQNPPIWVECEVEDCKCRCHELERQITTPYSNFLKQLSSPYMKKKHKEVGNIARCCDCEKLEKRLKKIEEWIDLWETYDSGWNKYRKIKKI